MSIDVSEMRGPLVELFDQCSGENGQARFEEFKLWLKKVSQLLKYVRGVAVAGITRFVAADKFVVNTDPKAKVRIWYVGDNFKAGVLGKIEQNVASAKIAVHTLLKASLDAPIMTELGARTEISLAHFWALIEAQGQGQAGSLLTNGYANIAYVKGVDGNVWAVVAYWNAGDGWSVFASSVECPFRWSEGYQVLSQVA